MIVCGVVYGSRARGDFTHASDFDVLLVETDTGRFSSTSVGGVNCHTYSNEQLFAFAGAGELFALHIASEAIPLFDNSGFLPAFKEAFRFKESYRSDISYASEVGWLLTMGRESFGSAPYVNRRIAWVVRTILIASAAEQRKPVFSARALADLSGNAALEDLISVKDDDNFNPRALERLREFLIVYGYPGAREAVSMPLSELRERFLKTGNKVGIKTLRQLILGSTQPELDDYPL